jgi:histidinol-phosphate/aromatic aminotransferase/cobyric acid decarboxylase-like protein
LLANPNNPTGRAYSREEVVRFLDAAVSAGLSAVVDESFIDFAGEGCGSVADYLLVNRLPGVVLIKSLSKSLGVPGLRLGYCLSGDTKVIEGINRLLPIWNSNSMAQYFLELLLKYRIEVAASFQRTILDREDLRRDLTQIDGIEARPSGGNFVLCRLTSGTCPAAELAHRLMDRGIYIKDCTSKFGDGGEYVRFAVRTPNDNAKLIAALRHALSGATRREEF